jgi:hypothetical protein
MKRSHLLFLAAATTIGLLMIAVSTLPSHSPAALAAPSSNSDPFAELFRPVYSPLYQGEEVMCTLTYTTTDSLNNDNACPVAEGPEICGEDKAVTLAGYDGLALVDETDVPDGQEIEVPTHADWFRLDNAKVGTEYTVKAFPDRTTNYNLGIVVYVQVGTTEPNWEQLTSDEDAVPVNSAEVSFEAESVGPYLFKVYQLTPACSGRTYRLEVTLVTPTATPEVETDEDEYEPNNSFEEAEQDKPTLPIQVPILLELTFHTNDDIDYFRFYTKEDRWYQATTSDLSLVDTLLEIYDEDQRREERDDDGGSGLASQASWEADYDGYYYIVVQNNVASSGSYNLTLTEISAPPTETPGPSPTPGFAPTPRSQADDCESNLDFHHACVLAVDRAETFNFAPVFGEGPDNDFYKIWVKSGLHFRCETSDLAPGVDPNMIMFSGPSWDNAIAGNDDIERGNYNSALNYYATYDGWLYVLVGTGDRTPPDITDSSYTLECEMRTEPFSATGTPRPTATPEAPGIATPTPTPTTSGSPVATPTQETQELTVRPLTTPAPAASVTPSPRFVPIRLLVYYDGNGDGQPGAGEGIAGISAQAFEVASNELLAQDFTDEQGNLEFTVSAQGPVRISIPFLGFSHLVTGAQANIQVRVPPRSLPGGTP